MKNWNLKAFKDDLSIFIKLIKDMNILGDFSGFEKLLESLESKTMIEYKLENLCFFIEGRTPGSFPQNTTYYQIYFDNMLMVKDNLDPNSDPLYGYYLDINIHAYESKSKKIKVSTFLEGGLEKPL